MNQKLIIYVVGLFGIAGLFGHTLKLYLIWMTAYITGNDVIVAINNYNEASPEFVFFPVTVTLGMIGLYCYFKMMLDEKKRSVI